MIIYIARSFHWSGWQLKNIPHGIYRRYATIWWLFIVPGNPFSRFCSARQSHPRVIKCRARPRSLVERFRFKVSRFGWQYVAGIRNEFPRGYSRVRSPGKWHRHETLVYVWLARSRNAKRQRNVRTYVRLSSSAGNILLLRNRFTIVREFSVCPAINPRPLSLAYFQFLYWQCGKQVTSSTVYLRRSRKWYFTDFFGR